MLNLLAFDMGASNYRCISGQYDGSTISVKVLCRFQNALLNRNGRLVWNFDKMYEDVKNSLYRAEFEFGKVDSFGIDSWGGDFGLLGDNGTLLDQPISYRDKIAYEHFDSFKNKVNFRKIYEITGCSIKKMTTPCMLVGMQNENYVPFRNAKRLLFMPDLFVRFFTGEYQSEYTYATTTKLINASTGDWYSGLLDQINLDRNLLCPVVRPGGFAGKILSKFSDEHTGLRNTQLVTVASHDTASAVVTIQDDENLVFISSGSWSVVGMVINEPILTGEAYEWGYENEGMHNGKIRLLKNITGLWLLNECMSEWKASDMKIDISELIYKSSLVSPLKSIIYPNDKYFISSGEMCKKIREFCRQTGQDIPATPAEITASIFQGLAMEYRITIAELQKLTGKKVNKIVIIGGGVKNSRLSQLTADSTGLPVYTGYSEAAALGNIMTQALAFGEITDSDMNDIVARSFTTQAYLPTETEVWEDFCEQYRAYRVD